MYLYGLVIYPPAFWWGGLAIHDPARCNLVRSPLESSVVSLTFATLNNHACVH